ncbi:cob(I)alamin adenosyltransferase [Thermosulfidibacter takaii ABI70S6]|uniref:corrinoid adenosyltransferase n=1 Tax=Thermosulfidibacter takaii (strain DSM 17441 / JCM 13301 / NBRC 103674 / ABI70S6) TaxID=1298851 RepID=A0A0S3QS02_THET7|nr:cob(I)yrinic acid a,c-diamide adenosyltransferase [Thermosulfidibacter takaii]BAT71097.1 cob(I)alamin adenosyltransferase [Thermosulfidibacter takaii ABI70S6]
MGKLKEGYVQVYTGNGKGKTTAALGLTLRAVGAGLRVYIAQFLKGSEYSEVKCIKERFSDLVDIEQFGTPRFVCSGSIGDEDYELAKNALQKIEEALTSGKYDIVIMEEANVAAYLGLIGVDDILRMIEKKPKDVELVITGRYAPEEVIEKADLVTEMKEVKHYYTKGVQARIGIEK